MTPVQTLGAQLGEKQKALAELYAAHKTTDAERPYSFTQEEVEHVRALNEELTDLGKKWDEARELDSIEAKNQQLGGELFRVSRLPFANGDVKRASTGEAAGIPATDDWQAEWCFAGESIRQEGYYRSDKNGVIELDSGRPPGRKDVEIESKDWDFAEYKTTFATSAGFAPQNIRSGRISLVATQPILVPDILPTLNVTAGNAYVYMLETTFTNNAAEARKQRRPLGRSRIGLHRDQRADSQDRHVPTSIG